MFSKPTARDGSGMVHIHKGFLAYVHVTADLYINGGAGPGVPKVNGVVQLDQKTIADDMQWFKDDIAWDKVKAFGMFEDPREDGTGLSAFQEGEVNPVPAYLQSIICMPANRKRKNRPAAPSEEDN